jgi:hypothetical protein
MRLGLELADALATLYPGRIDLGKCATLIGSHEVIRALRNGADLETILDRLHAPLDEFKARRKPYLLYE